MLWGDTKYLRDVGPINAAAAFRGSTPGSKGGTEQYRRWKAHHGLMDHRDVVRPPAASAPCGRFERTLRTTVGAPASHR